MATSGYDISARSIAGDQFNNKASSYAAFSGVNIVAHLNHVAIGSMMGVSYTIHTEKQANYVMGMQNPASFVTGKRGTAGTLVFAQFDRDPVLSIFSGTNGAAQPLIKTSDNYATKPIASVYSGGNVINPGQNGFPSDLSLAKSSDAQGTANSNYTTALNNDIADAFVNQYKIPLEYADQLPPFDVTLTMSNSLGQGAYMVIYGIEIINQGGGFTVDDSRNEVAYTYVCRGIRPLQPVHASGQLATSTVMLSSSTSNTL